MTNRSAFSLQEEGKVDRPYYNKNVIVLLLCWFPGCSFFITFLYVIYTICTFVLGRAGIRNRLYTPFLVTTFSNHFIMVSKFIIMLSNLLLWFLIIIIFVSNHFVIMVSNYFIIFALLPPYLFSDFSMCDSFNKNE